MTRMSPSRRAWFPESLPQSRPPFLRLSPPLADRITRAHMISCINHKNDFRHHRHPRLLLFLLTLFAVGSHPHHADENTRPQPPKVKVATMKPNEDLPRRFDHILDLLWDKDEKNRES